ncbi:MAG: anti-sigma factor family protein [Anaerolineae bacterium]
MRGTREEAMTCRGNEEVNLYLDNALGEEERARFEAHLARCPACQEELASLSRLFAALGSLETAPVPAGFAQEVVKQLPMVEAQARWGFPLRAILVGQAALTLLLLILSRQALLALYHRLGASLPQGWLFSLFAAAAARAQVSTSMARQAIGELARIGGEYAARWPTLELPALIASNALSIMAALLALWFIVNATLLRAPVRQRNGLNGS